MNRSKVTVLMPVYNACKYVREAVDSVLDQTFRDFELLIINDGSTDATRKILESYTDPRIRIINHRKNRGIVHCLNEGLSLVKSAYIARMDADDIALPTRLEKQVAYMDTHPEVAVCGTWLMAISGIKSEIWKAPMAHNEICALMLFHDALFHPTVMLRTEIMSRYHFRYSQHYSYAEDYALWVRIAKHALLANLPEVLLCRRIHKNKRVDDYPNIQEKSANVIRLDELRHLGIRPNRKELEIHNAISNWAMRSEKSFVTAAEKWLVKLVMANLKTRKYRLISFIKVIARKWFFVRFGGIGYGK